MTYLLDTVPHYPLDTGTIRRAIGRFQTGTTMALLFMALFLFSGVYSGGYPVYVLTIDEMICA